MSAQALFAPGVGDPRNRRRRLLAHPQLDVVLGPGLLGRQRRLQHRLLQVSIQRRGL